MKIAVAMRGSQYLQRVAGSGGASEMGGSFIVRDYFLASAMSC